jgi:hypothetical protein
MRLMKRVFGLGVLMFLAGAVAAQAVGGVAMAATAPTPATFQCAMDANGKCSQLLAQSPACVAIGLPIAPGTPGACTVRINGPDDAKGKPTTLLSAGVSNDPKTGGAIINYLRGWLRLANGAVALVIMLMLVVAGIQYITSLANPTSVAAAKKRITNAIIALVMWLMMFAALQFLMPGGIL